MKKIPEWVKIRPTELCLDGYEINSVHMGKKIYVMMVDNDASLDIVACPCPHLKEISFYANHFNVFKRDVDFDEVILAKVTVMDPLELPFEIPESESVFLIYEDWYLMEHENMLEATSDIESMLETHTDADISDFCVLIGTEVTPGIKKASLKLTHKLRNGKKREDANEYVFSIS